MNAVNNIMKKILALDEVQQKIVIEKITHFFNDDTRSIANKRLSTKKHRQVLDRRYFLSKLRDDKRFMGVINQINRQEAS